MPKREAIVAFQHRIDRCQERLHDVVEQVTKARIEKDTSAAVVRTAAAESVAVMKVVSGGASSAIVNAGHLHATA